MRELTNINPVDLKMFGWKKGSRERDEERLNEVRDKKPFFLLVAFIRTNREGKKKKKNFCLRPNVIDSCPGCVTILNTHCFEWK